jgi:hypothetical protein
VEEVERFEAEAADGRRYTVILWANMVTHQPLKGPAQRLRGGTVLQLLDGTHVNDKGGGNYEIFPDGIIIRRV